MKFFCKIKITILLVSLSLVFVTGVFSQEELNDSQPLSIEQKLKRMEKMIQELEKKQKVQDVMSQLQQTDEEKKEKEEDILDAAGREYTLATPGILNVSYSLQYTADTYDNIRQLTDENKRTSTEVRHINSHELTNSIYVKYPLKNNLTFSTSIPFAVKYSATSKDSQKGIGMGDPSFTFQYQPFKPKENIPTTIFSAGVTVPLGSNPYEIDPDDEIATGNGRYALFTGVNFSKTIDPIIAYGGFNYYRYFPITGLEYNANEEQKEQGYYIYKVKSGDTFALNIGMGYSLSYIVSISIGYQYSQSLPSNYYWKNVGKTSSSSSASSSLAIGTNWKISHKRSLNADLSIGLFNNNSDVTFSLSLPFDFKI